MKKPPLIVVIFAVLFIFTTMLVTIYYMVFKEGRALDTGEDYLVDSSFISVQKPWADLRNIPGEKEMNAGAEEFYGYLSEEGDSTEQLKNVYKLFKVAKISDASKKEVLLFSIEDRIEETYTFECSPERVFAFKNTSMNFISSGFEFIDVVRVGDTVLTKCFDKDCSILGPDCIVRVD